VIESRLPSRRSVVARPVASLPVTIITGFLGSGKTTLINTMLRDSQSGRLAVIVNEFGALGIDGPMLGEGAGRVVELSNGCMCCESRGNLASALAELSSLARSIDAVVIETSGVADPFGVADVLVETQFETDYVLTSVVTVIDADNFDANLNNADAAHRQMVCADVFVLSKADLVTSDVVDAISGRVRTINPHAAMIVADHGRLPVDLELDSLVARHRVVAHLPHEVKHELLAFSWTSARSMDVEVFTSWVDELPPTVKRLKAILVTSHSAVSVQRVGLRTTNAILAHSTAAALGGDAVRVTLFATELDEDAITNQLHRFQKDTK
jgi:G3E family GTPase